MNLNDADYLSLLQRTEKARRPVAVRSEEDRLREERERGFSIHFSGANREEKPKGRRATSVGRVSLQPASVVRRRGWNHEVPAQPVQPIETEEYAGEDFEEDCEDSLDADGDRDADAEASSPQILSNRLVDKVSVLDPKQQAMLLSLIDQVVAASPRPEQRNGMGFSPARSSRQSTNGGDLEAEADLTRPATERTPSRATLTQDEVQEDAEQVKDHPVDSSSEIRIRIRLNSVWESSGFVSLDGIELVNMATLASYDLRVFKVIVLNGLIPFPYSSDTMRHIDRLFRRQGGGQTPRVRREEPWRAPFNKNTTTIEIQLSGRIPKDEERLLRLRVVNSGSSSQQVKDMDAAVQTAAKLAQAGDVALLSPACSSLDMFDNFEHRGQVFAAAVRRRAGG